MMIRRQNLWICLALWPCCACDFLRVPALGGGFHNEDVAGITLNADLLQWVPAPC